uniref:Uncharacterized protein n=1 Tax=Eptatretus burgeri TaxID=7764 RepID=A0A8C4QUN4_EPTBU
MADIWELLVPYMPTIRIPPSGERVHRDECAHHISICPIIYLYIYIYIGFSTFTFHIWYIGTDCGDGVSRHTFII